MTESTAVPPVVETYLAAVQTSRLEALPTFAEDPEVTDDGTTYRGHDGIRGWLLGPASEYDITTTRLSAEVDGDRVQVVNRIEGDFPGGVVVLRHDFTLDASGRIARLTIAP